MEKINAKEVSENLRRGQKEDILKCIDSGIVCDTYLLMQHNFHA